MPMGTPWLGQNLEQLKASLVSKKSDLEKEYMNLTEKLISIDTSSSDFTTKLSKLTAGVFSKRNALDDSKLGLCLLSSETIEQACTLHYKSYLDKNQNKIDFIQSKSKNGMDAYIQVDGLLIHKENKEGALTAFQNQAIQGLY